MPWSLRKIVWNDWPALAATLAVPITWAVSAAFPLLHRVAAPTPLWLPMCASVLLAGVLAWRVARVHRLFATGKSVVGCITDLQIAKDRGRLLFLFELEGRRVRGWMPVHRTRAVLALAPGDTVTLLYDSRQPHKAIVRQLFAR